MKAAKKEKDVTETYGATINPTGNKIEFVMTEEDETGKKQSQTRYLSKEKEKDKG